MTPILEGDSGSAGGHARTLCHASLDVTRRGSEFDQPVILMIDDEVGPDDPLVQWLRLDGFAVDCADSGGAGLSRMQSRKYHAVVLDLRLPDLFGLRVLEQFRERGFLSPVIVVTGYHGDVDHAVAAMQRGAVDFKRKPLDGEDMTHTIRAAIASHNNARGISRKPPYASTTDFPPPLQELFDFVITLARGDVTEVQASDFLSKAWRPANADPRFAATEQLLTLIVDAVCEPSLTVPNFLVCGRALAYVVTTARACPARIAEGIGRTVGREAASLAALDDTVVAAVAKLEAATAAGRWLSERNLAEALGVDRAHLGRLISKSTKLGFREWRRAFAIKSALRQLSVSGNHIAQIAYSVGYSHPSQFDREFR